MGMSSLNISLPQALKQFIERRVAAGGYSTPSEYVRDLLREDLKRQADERIVSLVQEGLNSPPILVDANYWKNTRRELTRKLKSRRK